MKIEVLGGVSLAPVSQRLGRKSSPPRNRDRSPFRRARGGRGGRPNNKPAGGKPKREKKETMSAEDLDKVGIFYLHKSRKFIARLQTFYNILGTRQVPRRWHK